MLENTEGAFNNWQAKDTGNIDEEKQNKNTTQYMLGTTVHINRQTLSFSLSLSLSLSLSGNIDEGKKNKNTSQYMLGTTVQKQI